ncbi:hypothetical protein L3Q67_38230 [Saccharothrix sp. AJ9571]|nr:hypothetical protein L3Q67_38230 [Saccharothrix sp. AJ9571]
MFQSDVVAMESGEFAPAAAGPGGGDDQEAGDGAAQQRCLVGDAQHLIRQGPDPLWGNASGASAAAPSASDWVEGDEAFVGGVGQDHGEQVELARHGGWCVAGSVEFSGPFGDVEGGDGAERGGAEVGQDVAAQSAAVALNGAWGQIEAAKPA